MLVSEVDFICFLCVDFMHLDLFGLVYSLAFLLVGFVVLAHFIVYIYIKEISNLIYDQCINDKSCCKPEKHDQILFFLLIIDSCLSNFIHKKCNIINFKT